jgi:hypothetical protein
MRFRARWFSINSLTWLVLAIFQVALNFLRWRQQQAKGGSYLGIASEIVAVLWALVFVGYLLGPVWNYWEFDANCVRIREFWRTKQIPYHSIVAVRNTLGLSDKPERRRLEIETARISASIYPHDYLVVDTPTDRDAFLQALRDRAPEAEFVL